MNDITEVQKTATVTHDGKTYTIPRASFTARAMFAKFLEARAIDYARRNAALLGPEGLAETLRGIANNASAGIYSWGGRLMNEAIRNDFDALSEAIFIVITQKHQDLNRELFAAMLKTSTEELVAKFFEVNNDQPANPPGPPPAAA